MVQLQGSGFTACGDCLSRGVLDNGYGVDDLIVWTYDKCINKLCREFELHSSTPKASKPRPPQPAVLCFQSCTLC